MKIKHTTFKGRAYFYGHGTYEEVEALNREPDFDHVLDTLYAIMLEAHHVLGIKGEMKVDRSVIGLRTIGGDIIKYFTAVQKKRGTRGTRKAI